MKSWIGLSLAIALGVVAGFLNWWIIKGEVTSRSFVTAVGPIEAGRTITEDDLASIELRGDLEALAKSAVPFEERAVLLDRPAARDLHEGELVLWIDVLPPAPTELLAEPGEEALPVSLEGISVVPTLLKVGQEVGFLITQRGPPRGQETRAEREPFQVEYVGPFRILSVGERLGPEVETGRSSRGGDERVITVAIRREERAGADVLNDDSRKLVEAIDAMRSGRDAERRIVSILLQPAWRTSTPAGETAD